jgi:hypothetical protein
MYIVHRLTIIRTTGSPVTGTGVLYSNGNDYEHESEESERYQVVNVDGIVKVDYYY